MQTLLEIMKRGDRTEKRVKKELNMQKCNEDSNSYKIQKKNY